MTDVDVIILAKNEHLHIGRCLDKLVALSPRQIFVVDCLSTDDTRQIAEEKGAQVVEHEWPGNQAAQFNWALDNLPITASWILRLDADEYLFDNTVEEVMRLLPKWDGEIVASGGLPPDVTSLSLSRSRVFCGQKIRFGGTAHIPMVRFFKKGIGHCQDRAMDEHIVVSQGRIIDFGGAFYDDSLMPFEVWKEKHRGYAKREAMDAISLFNNPERMKKLSPTDRKKVKYYKMPPYFRAVAYFCIRYFLKFGFLDGLAGFRWHFWQGLWYRWIVDREIGKLESSR